MTRKNDLVHLIRRSSGIRIHSYCRGNFRIEKGTEWVEGCTCERCIKRFYDENGEE